MINKIKHNFTRKVVSKTFGSGKKPKNLDNLLSQYQSQHRNFSLSSFLELSTFSDMATIREDKYFFKISRICKQLTEEIVQKQELIGGITEISNIFRMFHALNIHRSALCRVAEKTLARTLSNLDSAKALQSVFLHSLLTDQKHFAQTPLSSAFNLLCFEGLSSAQY